MHYIPALHWAGRTGRETHKKSPRPRGMRTRQYNMSKVVQIVQQLHQNMHQLVCQSLIIYKRKSDEATSLSLTAEDTTINASRASLEAFITTWYMRWGGLYPRQTNTYLPIFSCLQAERATRQCRPLLHYATWQLSLLAHREKRSSQVYCPQVAL